MSIKRVASLLLFLALAACGSKAPNAALQQATAVSLAQGQVIGIPSPFDDDIRVYRGLPYAAAPVDDLRWQPPQIAATWEGVRVADTFADSCFQLRHTSTFVWRRENFPVSEDCLFLNVWARENAEKLPVMVWFHGGSHTSGQGHSLIFDGTTLAQRGVVVVTVNYRLGPFGFLAHPWLSKAAETGTSGNYGLMDKIAALEWVRDNALALGGDPDNVTIFGQSAGSQSVCSLMASSAAQGLFHKAIGQSAACVNPLSIEDANGHLRGSALVDSLGADSLEALQLAEPDALLSAMIDSAWEADSRIVIDGDVLGEWPSQTYAEGRQAKIPLMLGFLDNEGEQLFPVDESVKQAGLDGFLNYVAGDLAEELKAEYDTENLTPGQLQHAVSTDIFMAFGMQRWAEYHALTGQPTYLYFMDHVPPAFHLYMPEQPYLALEDGSRSGGAYHSGDLALVFGSLDKVGYDWTAEDEVVSEQMVTHWTNFAKTGNPNRPGEVAWAPFDRERLSTRVINSEPATIEGVRKRILEILSSRQPL